jgi:hypothetical protein
VGQVDVSRTILFDSPRPARGFLEALCTDNPRHRSRQADAVVFGRRVHTPVTESHVPSAGNRLCEHRLSTTSPTR